MNSNLFHESLRPAIKAWMDKKNQARLQWEEQEMQPRVRKDWYRIRPRPPLPSELMGDRNRIDRKHDQAVRNLYTAPNDKRRRYWWNRVVKYYYLQRIRGHAIMVRQFGKEPV